MMPPGPSGAPTFPMNILGDFAGGGLMCAVGVLLALIERGRSGRGQVVNTDMESLLMQKMSVSSHLISLARFRVPDTSQRFL